MDAQALIKKIHFARQEWIEVRAATADLPAQRLCVRRPPRWDALPFGRGIPIETVLASVVDWDGFTEADLLGADQAPDDPVKFDAALFAVLARDRIDWVDAVTTKLVTMVSASFEAKDAAAKN